MSAQRPDGTLTPTFQPLKADDPTEVGGYRLYARLGAGGMGRVYLSYTRGGRPVALKVVRPELAEDPEFRQRFAQEVASARLIHGLYTAQVVDAGVADALPWLATAYVPGPSLHQVVRDHGPLPEHSVLLLVAGIAEALGAIHAAGVVHRDLKPANVLLASDGPRVIDFGIARAADAAALTGAGLRIGSPGFMAPEQALGRAATPATDVFALGALAAYVACGTPPFGHGPESGALYRVVHEEPDLSALPPSLAGLVRWCLAKEPGDRPTPARLIEAVHGHPVLGGQLRFADGWLPEHLGPAIVRHGELPDAPAQDRTLRAFTAPHEAPTADGPSVRPVPPREDPGPAPRAAARRAAGRGRRRTLALAAALALAAGTGAAYHFLGPGSGHTADAGPRTPSGSGPASAPPGTRGPSPAASGTTVPAPAAPPGYRTVYTGTRLVSPDQSYEFDLETGQVVPEGTAEWFLGRSEGEFVPADDNDAYAAPDARLTPADCLEGLDTRPVTTLDLAELAGRSFCVRGDGGRDLAVVRVLAADPDDGPVSLTVDHYRATGE
ncbi:protein kinase [Streptomyces sp. NPDC101118]|uniref:serine/threonine-protein kinase n=1 Tax=Streptomyces sp. NPDC101118 TaxID=3366109 RepID=UPI00382B87E3